MTTDAQAAANRQSLTNLLIYQQGLSSNPSDWSYDQRVAFNKAFAAYVAANPDSFSAQDETTAAAVIAEPPSALEDDSLSSNIAAFGSDLVDNAIAAGKQVAGIGQGLLTAAQMAAWVIPGGLLILAGIWLYGQYKKQTRAP